MKFAEFSGILYTYFKRITPIQPSSPELGVHFTTKLIREKNG